MSVQSLESPAKAIDQVLQDLLDSDGVEKLTVDEMKSYLATLCEGYHCGFSQLPEPFATMAEVARSRGATYGFDRSRFFDLLRSAKRAAA